MKLKRRTEEEKISELFVSMILTGKSMDVIKREVFLLRILAIFMLAFNSSIIFISLNFDTSEWGYYWTDGLKLVMFFFWFGFLFSVFMAMYHNHKYKLLMKRMKIQLPE